MMTYEWVKVAHLLAVISWMAGLLYLPRLMVYHAGAVKHGELSETLKVMERRLLKAIMTPAMIASWAFGIWLGVIQGYWSELPLWFRVANEVPTVLMVGIVVLVIVKPFL
jgi:putative membrane protein